MSAGQVTPFTQIPNVVHFGDPATSKFQQVQPNAPLPVTNVGSSGGTGLSTGYVSCTASTNATVVKVGAGKMFKVKAFNNGNVPVFLKFYDKATTPVPASDAVFDKYEIPSGTGGAGLLDEIELGQQFNNGIAFAVTANFVDNDNTAIGSGVVSVTVLYL